MKVAPSGHVQLDPGDVGIVAQLATMLMAHQPDLQPHAAVADALKVLIESGKQVTEHNRNTKS